MRNGIGVVAIVTLCGFLSGCAGEPTEVAVPPPGEAETPGIYRTEFFNANLSGDLVLRQTISLEADGACKYEWSFKTDRYSDRPTYFFWATQDGELLGARYRNGEFVLAHAHAGPADTRPAWRTYVGQVYPLIPFYGGNAPTPTRENVEIGGEAGKPLNLHLVVFGGAVAGQGGSGIQTKLECSAPFQTLGFQGSTEPTLVGSMRSGGGAGANVYIGGYANVMDSTTVATSLPTVDFLFFQNLGKGSYRLTSPNGTDEWSTEAGLQSKIVHKGGGPGTWKFEFTRVGAGNPMVGIIAPMAPLTSWDLLVEDSK